MHSDSELIHFEPLGDFLFGIYSNSYQNAQGNDDVTLKYLYAMLRYRKY